MDSENDKINSRKNGALTIWTSVVIVAICLLIALISLQVLEHLFYKATPSLWPGKAAQATQTSVKLQTLSAEKSDIDVDKSISKPKSTLDSSVDTSEKISPAPTSAIETHMAEAKEITNAMLSDIETRPVKSDESTNKPTAVIETKTGNDE